MGQAITVISCHALAVSSELESFRCKAAFRSRSVPKERIVYSSRLFLRSKGAKTHINFYSPEHPNTEALSSAWNIKI